MSPAEALANAGAFTVQLAAVVLAAGLLEAVLPVDRPRARLVYWQGVLLLVLALPFVQPWRVLPSAASLPTSSSSSATAPLPPAPARESAPPIPIAMSPPAIVLAVFLAGAAAVAVRLAFAARALRRARRRSRPLPPDVAAPGTELRLSPDVTSPVTFGLRRPVILLPESFEHLGEAERRSVICHETVHIERRDWLVQTFEELLRVPLWFHPAFHWLLGRLRLAREQAVDAEVVERLGGRTAYLEALIALASGGRASRLVPAASFFTRSHLAERVDLLLKEEPMSRVRVLLSLVSSAAAVALCAAGIMTVAPFHAIAEVAPPAPPAPVMVALPPMPSVDVQVDMPPVPPVLVIAPVPPMPPVHVAEPADAPPAPPAEARGKRSGGARQNALEAIHEERRAVEQATKALEQARRQLEEQSARIGEQAAKLAEEHTRRALEQAAHIREEAIKKAQEQARGNAEERARVQARLRELEHRGGGDAERAGREKALEAKLLQMEKRLREYEEALAKANGQNKASKE